MRPAKCFALFLAAFVVSTSFVSKVGAQRDRSNSCDVVLAQAQAALQSENPQQAEARIRASALTCQQTVRAWALLGASLDEQGKHDEAQRIFLRAITRSPEWASLHDNLGLSYLHAGKDQEALLQFREAIRLDPHDGLAILNLAGCLVRLKQFEKALSVLVPLAHDVVGDPEWYAVLTEAYLGAGRNDEALESAQEAVKAAGESPGIDFSLGLLFARYGRNEEAVNYFLRIPTVSRDFSTDFDLGLAYEQLGKLDDASTAFSAAIGIDSTDVTPYLELATIDVERSAPEEALTFLVKAHQIAPERIDVIAELVELLIQTERLNDAEELLTAETHQHPTAALLRKVQGDLYNRQNLDRQALNAYEESLKIDSQLFDSRIGMARVFQRLGQDDEARSEYAQVLRSVPTCGAANSGMGVLDLAHGDAAEAIPYLKRALDEEASDIDTGKSLANAYMRAGDYESAHQTLGRLEMLDPNNSQVHYLQGQVLMKLNEKTQAQDEFSKAQSVLNTPPARPAQAVWFTSAGCSARHPSHLQDVTK